MDLSQALDQPGGGGGSWPSNNNPTAQSGGMWNSPGQGSGAGGWPAPAQGGWPSPAPGSGPSAPGGWPSPAPGPGPAPSAPGGWPSPAPGPAPSGPGGWPSPAPGPGPAPSGPGGGWPGPAAPQQSLTVPYTQSLPRGVYNNLMITIAGTVKPKPHMFTVDLATVTNDLAFHFNPRFNENGHQVVVRNSLLHKQWGTEERHVPHFPFAPGKHFEMKIMCTNNEFKVAVNGSHMLDYKHRFKSLHQINQLQIFNDVTLTKVLLETLP